MSKHGIFIHEEGTALAAPISGNCAVQVVIGTAPVNMAANPAEVVNKPILANSAQEAMAALGYCTDFKNYTLCQSMYVTGNIYQISPVVYINVLDPAKHKKNLEKQTVQVNQMQAVVKKAGILKEGLTVTGPSASPSLENGTDYTLSFDTEGNLVITLIAGKKGNDLTSLEVTGNILDPSMVKATDIVGAVDPSTGAETGAQLIRDVYPSLGIVPGLILAPGWSQTPEVGIALAAKAANINGVFKAMALLDLDTTKAKKYTDCKKVKEDSGYTSAFCTVLWPCDKVGEMVIAKSAVVAAMMAYQDSANGDVPNLSPSNKMLGVTGQCLADGTEVCIDQDQASTVNTYGVVTATNVNGWRCWGNYTGAYPGSNDAKDIWIPVRRMFNWHGNTFIQTYFNKVDDPMNQVLIESIVDSENIRCAAYAPDKWAGASIEYRKADNPTTDILAGKMTFRQKIAPYTPAQEINNTLSYDTDLLASVLGGGE